LSFKTEYSKIPFGGVSEIRAGTGICGGASFLRPSDSCQCGPVEMGRERFSSRLGFILISAGCAIGLGNVWRFPYIVGQYGGAAFVLIYAAFLVLLGLPIIVMEYSVGRASQKSAALSFDVLEPKGTKWHFEKWFAS